MFRGRVVFYASSHHKGRGDRAPYAFPEVCDTENINRIEESEVDEI